MVRYVIVIYLYINTPLNIKNMVCVYIDLKNI